MATLTKDRFGDLNPAIVFESFVGEALFFPRRAFSPPKPRSQIDEQAEAAADATALTTGEKSEAKA